MPRARERVGNWVGPGVWLVPSLAEAPFQERLRANVGAGLVLGLLLANLLVLTLTQLGMMVEGGVALLAAYTFMLALLVVTRKPRFANWALVAYTSTGMLLQGLVVGDVGDVGGLYTVWATALPVAYYFLCGRVTGFVTYGIYVVPLFAVAATRGEPTPDGTSYGILAVTVMCTSGLCLAMALAWEHAPQRSRRDAQRATHETQALLDATSEAVLELDGDRLEPRNTAASWLLGTPGVHAAVLDALASDLWCHGGDGAAPLTIGVGPEALYLMAEMRTLGSGRRIVFLRDVTDTVSAPTRLVARR